MKTIDLQEFTDNFMEISNTLTHAEIRMLYLLIAEPDVINLSRQEIADKIGKDRRTVLFGLKKLLKHQYISGVVIKNQKVNYCDINITNIDNGDKNITASQPKSTNIINLNSKDLIDSSKISYYEILNDFLRTKKTETLTSLFEEFPNRRLETLNAIRFNLPNNIDSLAKKYGIVEGLRIIRIANNEIKKMKKDPTHKPIWNMNGVVDEYIKSHYSERKKSAMKYVRQALVYFPFTFDKFMNNIRAYKFPDLDELVNKLKMEIYNSDKLQ